MISVGIDIGRSSVKVAEVEAVARAYIVKRFLEFPLSVDPHKDKKIETIDILRKVIPQYNPDQTKFIFCVRQEDVSLRLKQFPFRERHKILRTVPFEVEDEIPFSQENAIFEAKIVRFEGRGADVLAMACPKDRVRDVIQLARDGGTHPALVSLETAALSNLLENWENPPTEVTSLNPELNAEKNGEVVLDIGAAATKCLFYEGGALIAVRHIDWGGRNIVAAVAQKYSLSLLQATKEIEVKAFIALDKTKATKEQAAFSKVIETATADLVRELRLKILEVKADNHLNIVKGHITGGPTQMKGLPGYLTQHLELPFNRFKFLSMLPNVMFEADPRTEAVSGVAIGLALEGLKRPRNPAIDFLKDDFASQTHVFERLWEKWGYAVQIGAAAFVLFFVYSIIRDSMAFTASERSTEVLRQQAGTIANLKGSAASSSKIRKFLSDHEKMAKSRKMAEKILRLNSALDVLNTISAAIPDQQVSMDVKHLSIEGEIAEIKGYVSNGRIGDLQRALQSASMDGKVESVSSQLPAQGNRQPFGFRFKVNRLEGG